MKKNTTLSGGKVLLHILAVLAGFILIQMAGSLAALIPIAPVAIILTSALTIGLFYLFLKIYTQKVAGLTMAELRVNKPDSMVLWTVCAVALPLLVSGFFVLFTPGAFAVSPLTGGERAEQILYAIFLPCLIAGITEELLFRGFIMRILEIKWGRWVAVMLPSVLFGILHITNLETFGFVDVLQMVIAGTSVGILFSLVALQSGSIWPGALIHGLWNLWIIGGILDIGAQHTGTNLMTYTLASQSTLITGGAFGIEGSLPAIVGYWLMIFITLLVPKSKAKP